MSQIVNCKSQKNFINRNDIIASYFNDIRKYPVLSHEQQRQLVKVAQYGDKKAAKEARDKLVNCNQRFIVSMARKWYRGDNLMDIINEANIGLMTAIEKYDINRTENFLTYAVYWIRKSINEYVITHQDIVRPANAAKLHSYVNKAKSRFFNENERYPTNVELKEILEDEYGINVPDATDLLQLDLVSLDDLHGWSGEENTKTAVISNKLNDVMSKTSDSNIEDDINRDYLNEKVTRAMSILSDREKYVVMAYYGIGRDEESFDSISLKLGVCRERIRQIFNESIKKMQEGSEEIN